MSDDGPEWFAPKRYGYGAGLPIAWQGWAVIVGLSSRSSALPRMLPARPADRHVRGGRAADAPRCW